MVPRRKPPAVNETEGGQQNQFPIAKEAHQPAHQPKARRQLYIFLMAADIVVLLVYFFLVQNDVWERQSARLRSIGSLAGSLIVYVGLKAVIQKYVAKFTFLDETWFRAMVLVATGALWPSILPIWSVKLAIQPPQRGLTEVQILGQAGMTASANAKESPGDSMQSYRTCESGAAAAEASAKESTCVLGGLLLRTYEIKMTDAPHATYLPAASIFAKTFTRGVFRVQLPCNLEIYPVFPGEQVFTKRPGEPEKAQGLLPNDGVLWLMPGYYEHIKATHGQHVGMHSGPIACGDKVEIALE